MTATPVEDNAVGLPGTLLARRRSVALDSGSVRAAAVPAVRRGLDIAGAGLMLLVLLPLFVAIMIAIRLTSSGPVFYVKERVGRNGAPFMFIKFRTMAPGADLLRSEILGTPDEDMPERYREDPRITAVGRVLRRWSIDELPQLINVLRGDMSLVGPRPILFEEVPLLEPWQHDRHLCRPGLTGLWQVSGRKETSWDERIALDLDYVRTRSLRKDTAILARTVGVVIRGDGAY